MPISSLNKILAERFKKSIRIPEFNGEIFYTKNLNVHRCILIADLSETQTVAADQIRAAVERCQPASWFRGMGFGVVLQVNSVEEVGSLYAGAVDIRSRRSGTWQWTILHSNHEKVAQGFHTWTRGITSDVFQAILRKFHAEHYRVSDQKIPMDRLMSVATRWSVQGRLLAQYEEIFPQGQTSQSE